MIKTIRPYLIIFVAHLLLTSCASILNSKFQKVGIKTTENTTVLVDGRKPEMKNGKYLVRRDAISKQITIKKEGYKDLNTTLVQYKKSPLYFFSIVPFGITIFPIMLDNMIKSRDYVKNISIESKMIGLPNKEKISSIVKLNNINVKPNNNEIYSWSKIPYRKFVHNKSLDKRKENRKVIDFPLSSSSLKIMFLSLFEKKGYIKYETNDIEKLYISATITDYSESSYYSPAMAYGGTIGNYGSMFTSNLAINWEVVGNNKNIVFSYQTQTKSGQFAYGGGRTKSEVRTEAIKDAIETGFIELVKTDDFSKQLDKRSEQSH